MCSKHKGLRSMIPVAVRSPLNKNSFQSSSISNLLTSIPKSTQLQRKTSLISINSKISDNISNSKSELTLSSNTGQSDQYSNSTLNYDFAKSKLNKISKHHSYESSWDSDTTYDTASNHVSHFGQKQSNASLSSNSVSASVFQTTTPPPTHHATTKDHLVVKNPDLISRKCIVNSRKITQEPYESCKVTGPKSKSSPSSTISNVGTRKSSDPSPTGANKVTPTGDHCVAPIGAGGNNSQQQPQQQSLSTLAPNESNTERQLAKQLKEKEIKISQLLKALNEKERVIDDLYFEMDGKDEKIVELYNEIKKRKQDMGEMSRKIFEMDRELKMCRSRFDYEPTAPSRPLSQLSFDSIKSDRVVSNHKWLKIASLSKALRNPLKGKNKVSRQKSTGEYIEELKTILQEKEMMITDLRLESKLATYKLGELQNTLRKKEEESFVIKKNNEYFEKVIKSKLID